MPLPSGGYLIIDQAEALTAIDVNTGRFVGKGSQGLEETILKTNLEAVDEIAYQLRFRNIGGLIILDLIDMERHANREKVRRALEELLAEGQGEDDAEPHQRARPHRDDAQAHAREPRARAARAVLLLRRHRAAPVASETIAYEILRQIRRERAQLPGYSVVVNAHPAVVDFMQTEERAAVEEAEPAFQRRITAHPAQGVSPRAVRSAGEVKRPRDHDGHDERRDERVTINKEFESFDAFIQEYVTNISRTGVFIKTATPLPVGTSVNLGSRVIMDDIETVEGIGEVVRVEADPPGMGVVFRSSRATPRV